MCSRDAIEINRDVVDPTAKLIRAYWRSEGVPDKDGDEYDIIRKVIDLYEIKKINIGSNKLDTIIMSSGGSARSIKLRNILLDLRKLIKAVATSTLTIVGSVEVPWTIPLAALLVLDTLFDIMAQDINEKQASVLYALWSRSGEIRSFNSNDLLDIVNNDRNDSCNKPLTADDLTEALDNLKQIGCIKQISKEKKEWQICESIIII